MQQIHGTQIRAARAMLNWSQDDLAQKSGLAATTIRNIESGFVPRGKTADIIRGVFEDAGLEFTELEGVRRCVEEIKILYEPDSCHQFYEDILQTIRSEGDEILACVPSGKIFAQACCIDDKDGPSRLKKLSNFAKIKCIVPMVTSYQMTMPMMEFRQVDEQYLGPSQYFVYGMKHALVLPVGKNEYRFVIFRSTTLALGYRKHFEDLWSGIVGEALPLQQSHSEMTHV